MQITEALKKILNGESVPTTGQFRTGLGQLFDFVTGILGTDTNDPTALQSLLGEVALNSIPLVSGLSGTFNAGAPATKFDVTASRVTTVNSAGKTKTYTNVGTKTVDITTQGIGGRDQTFAFAAFAEPNLFYIPDGAGGLGIIASLNSLSTGPNGYSEFAPIMNHKLDGNAQFFQGTLRGYEFTLTNARIIANLVTAGFPATASYSNLVPSKAAHVFSFTSLVFEAGGTSASAYLNLSHLSASSLVNFPVYASAGGRYTFGFPLKLPISAALAIYYGYSVQTGPQVFQQTVSILGWESGI